LRGSKERVDLALGGGVEAAERRQDLAGREDLDPEPPAARFFDHLRQSLGRAVVDVKHRGECRGHSPLDLRLGDDIRSVSDDGSRAGGHRATCVRDEPAPVNLHDALLTVRLPFTP
jgi:hypothetical protein